MLTTSFPRFQSLERSNVATTNTGSMSTRKHAMDLATVRRKHRPKSMNSKAKLQSSINASHLQHKKRKSRMNALQRRLSSGPIRLSGVTMKTFPTRNADSRETMIRKLFPMQFPSSMQTLEHLESMSKPELQPSRKANSEKTKFVSEAAACT